jgi:SH3 domain-containing YSC84-like protein 1
MIRLAAALALGGMLALALPAASQQPPATLDQQLLVDRATVTINAMRTDVQFGFGRDLLTRAKGVMVVPELIKAGFFFGGEGGSAVLLARREDGSWSDPAFYVLGSASFGLQIGVETAEVVFFVMSDRALKAWMEDEVKLGAKAGLTVLMIGSNAEASATTNANVDVIAWARSKGAYAGITLEGSLIKPRHEWNEAYYARPVKPAEIVFAPGVGHGRTIALRDALRTQ